MQKNTVKLWSGLGVALVLGTGGAIATTSSPADAAPVHMEGHASHGVPVTLAAGGEGGEGGEAGNFATADDHAGTVGQLLLVRGHLDMGQALYADGKPDDALPHFMHPAEEIYESIEPELLEHNFTTLGDALTALSNAGKAKADKAEIAKMVSDIDAQVEDAIKAIGGDELSTKHFLYSVAVPVMQTVADEYGAAFRDGRIVNVVEYQDSRGFILALEEFLKAHGMADDEKLVAAIRATKPAWPAIAPPASPVLQPSEVLAEVSRIELMSGSYRK